MHTMHTKVRANHRERELPDCPKSYLLVAGEGSAAAALLLFLVELGGRSPPLDAEEEPAVLTEHAEQLATAAKRA